MKTLTFSSGDIIFRQGDQELTMFDIRTGRVGVYDAYQSEQENRIAELGKGQLLGEMGMIEAYPRSATAVALEDGTVLVEITEDELAGYFRDRPDQLLRIMKQLSARIRETDQKFFDACHALRENEEAFRTGAEKSEALNRKLETISRDAETYGNYHVRLRSAFFQYVMDDVAEYGSKAHSVNAGLFERLLVRKVDPEKLHVNPEDEFADPAIGPNDGIIGKYVHMIPQLMRADQKIYPEPVVVQKMNTGGYMILNGHHRWAAALKTGVAELKIQITNPN